MGGVGGRSRKIIGGGEVAYDVCSRMTSGGGGGGCSGRNSLTISG
jgi:hypothetical protein